MKSVKVKCPTCKRKYLADVNNTKFTGPYMTSICAYCSNKYSGKFLTFLVRQEYDSLDDEVERFEACKSMIKLAQLMDKRLNPDHTKIKANKK